MSLNYLKLANMAACKSLGVKSARNAASGNRGSRVVSGGMGFVAPSVE